MDSTSLDIQQPLAERPYRSKRVRPCDLCRLRKVCCKIETELPCTNCRLNKTACTFLQPPSKRPKPSIPSLDDSLNGLRGEEGFIMNLDDVFQDNFTLDTISDQEAFHLVANSPLQERGNPRQHEFNPSAVGGYSPPFDLDSAAPVQGQALQQATDWMLDDEDIPSHHLLIRRSKKVSDVASGPLEAAEDRPSQGRPEDESGQSLDCQAGFSAQIFGLSGESDPYLLRHFHWNKNDMRPFIRVHFRRVNSEANGIPIHFAISKDELAAELKLQMAPQGESGRGRLNRLIPPEDGLRMIRLFLKYVFPYLPIVSRTQLLSTGAEDSGESSDIISRTPTHLLAAIYATALPFSLYDDYLCIQNGYKLPETSQLWSIVLDESPAEILTPHLSTVQAMLLYVQRPPTPGTSAAADTPLVWSVFASVVAQATSIGLHLDCAKWQIPAWEKRIRKRLWWAILFEDKFRSMLRGVPSLISGDQWDVAELTDEDFALPKGSDGYVQNIGEDDTDPLCKRFRYLASLSLVMADLYSAFYTVKSAIRWSDDLLGSLSTAVPIQNQLRMLCQAVPELQDLGMDKNFLLDKQAPSQGSSNAPFQFAYLIIQIFLYRALLRPLGRGNFAEHNARQNLGIQENSRASNSSNADVDGNVVEVISAAEAYADQVISFTERLDSVDVTAFWHSCFRVGFATMTNFVVLLYAQAPSSQLAEKAKRLIERWRRALKIKSSSFEQAKLGLLRLDSIIWIGLDKIFDEETKGDA